MLTQPLHEQPAIAIRDLTKIFHPPASGWFKGLLRSAPGTFVRALDRVNITVEQGEIFGLVGRNGQGKTTLIKSIASLLEPTEGSVKVFGRDTMADSAGIKSLIGMVAADERSFYGPADGGGRI